MRHYIYLFILLVVIVALYVFVPSTTIREGMTSGTPRQCPDLLIQKGVQIYLYNTRVAKIPGVNPIIFANLEDYTEYIDWQHSQGIRCPVLFLQHSYDTQGQSTYRVRPSPFDLQGGLPPNTTTTQNSMGVKPLVDATTNHTTRIPCQPTIPLLSMSAQPRHWI
jgi:hypothetical protein